MFPIFMQQVAQAIADLGRFIWIIWSLEWTATEHCSMYSTVFSFSVLAVLFLFWMLYNWMNLYFLPLHTQCMHTKSYLGWIPWRNVPQVEYKSSGETQRSQLLLVLLHTPLPKRSFECTVTFFNDTYILNE